MLFTNRKVQDHFEIKIQNTIIERVQTYKFLGVIIDDQLKWTHHINSVCKKVNQSIGILVKLKNIFKKTTLINVYKTFTQPHLMYCNIVWGNTAQTHLKPLFIAQKKALKIALKLPQRTPSDKVFEQARVHTIEQINKIQVSLFMYKYSRHILPQTFANQFIANSKLHSHNTRSSQSLHTPFPKLDLMKRSILYHGPILWNSLTSDIKLAKSISECKVKLKSFFI